MQSYSKTNNNDFGRSGKRGPAADQKIDSYITWSIPEGASADYLVSVEAEQAVLGTCLISSKAALTATSTLRASDFYFDAHRYIFESISDLVDSGVSPDVLTIVDRMIEMNFCDEERGENKQDLQRLIYELTGSVPTAEHCEHYCNIVKDKAIRRGIAELGRQIVSLSVVDNASVEEVIAECERGLSQIVYSNQDASLTGISTFAEPILQHLSEIPEKPALLQTDIRAWDDAMGGGLSPSMHVIAGRPGMGKTALGLKIAMNVAERGIPVAVFSLEMSTRELLFRMIGNKSRVPFAQIRQGGLRGAHLSSTVEAVTGICNLPIFIDDKASQSVEMLKSKVRELKSRVDIGLVVVDYIQICGESPIRAMRGRNDAIAHISAGLLAIAKDNDVPLLALSQLNRESVKERESGLVKAPRLDQLRDSGAVEQDAYSVLALHRPEYYRAKALDEFAFTGGPETCEMHLLKSRGSQPGMFKVECELSFFDFRDIYRGSSQGGNYYGGGDPYDNE